MNFSSCSSRSPVEQIALSAGRHATDMRVMLAQDGADLDAAAIDNDPRSQATARCCSNSLASGFRRSVRPAASCAGDAWRHLRFSHLAGEPMEPLFG
jgi:hypothetical protein